MPNDTSTPAAQLARLAATGDDAGVAAALARLERSVLVDALEAVTLAHEAVALDRSSDPQRIKTYRSIVLAGIAELARRSSAPKSDAAADPPLQPEMLILMPLLGAAGGAAPGQPLEVAIEKPAASLLSIAVSAVNDASSRRESAVVAVVFSAIWVEAYFNQLLELVDFLVKGNIQQVPAGVMLAIEAQRDLEVKKKSLSEKIARFAEALTGKAPDRGRSPYQELQLLTSLRDVLVHCWPTRVRGAGEGRPLDLARSSFSSTDVTSLVERLAEQGVLSAAYVATQPPILEAMRRPEMAKWALDAAQTVARYVADCFPTPAMKLWANRENALSGAPPAQYRKTGSGIMVRVPD